jgi:hypothetical protein
MSMINRPGQSIAHVLTPLYHQLVNMNFDDPSLEPFEPLVRRLLPHIFESGIDELRKAGIIRDASELKVALDDRSTRRRFFRGCHYGWNLAQGRIAELVIEYQEKIVALKGDLKGARRDRNQETIAETQNLIACLTNRQLVLRRLADTIFYHLIRHENWVARHICTEHRIRDIDTTTLRKTVEQASELNREDRRIFHLVSDLTTVVQIGDLVRNDMTSTPPGWSLIELKDGRMNTILLEELGKIGGKLDDEAAEQIREKHGDKAVSQAKRIIRQQERQKNLMQLYETDTGIDPMYQLPVTLRSEVVQVDAYATELPGMCERAEKKGLSVTVSNDCLRIMMLARDEYLRVGQRGVAHIFYHLRRDNRECTLVKGDEEQREQELAELLAIPPFFDLVEMNLHAMWPPPLFLWPVLPDRTLDLVFGRLRLFVQFDYELFFEMGRKEGIEMRWASDKEVQLPQLSYRIPGSPNSLGVFVELIGDQETHVRSLVMFNGFFGRLFHEMMTPKQLLHLVRESFKGKFPEGARIDPSEFPGRSK